MAGFYWFRRPRGSTGAPKQPSSEQGGQPGGRRFFFFGGRRYLADAPYILPKDALEVHRLDFQHYMLRYALRGNYAAPIGQPTSILDVGCGTGRWPAEMAAAFPAANVVGLDLEQPLPEAGAGSEHLPENYAFVHGDVLQGLPFPNGDFDFVHQRLLMGAIPAPRWGDVARELARVTRPGGWVEMVEAAPAAGGGRALATLNGWMLQATSRRGVDVAIASKLTGLLQYAGLQGIQSRQLDLPMGQGHGRLGAMAETQYFSLFQGLRGPIVGAGIVSAEAFDQTMAAARDEIRYTPAISPYVVAYGRRPA
jgi:Methyltransferase domain